MKQGCRFYVAFTETDSIAQYRCSGNNTQHKCERDPDTWDRYAQYRTRDPVIQQHGVPLLMSGIGAGQAAAFLNSQNNTRVRSKDLSRMNQTNKKKMQSLSDQDIESSECQRLLQAIIKNGDQYRVKFRGDTQVMDSIFYWDPTEVQLARRFSQVKISYNIAYNIRLFNLIRLSEIMSGDILYLRSRLQQMK